MNQISDNMWEDVDMSDPETLVEIMADEEVAEEVAADDSPPEAETEDTDDG